jgi:hypothetical protein
MGPRVLPSAQGLEALPKVQCNLEVAGNYVARLEAAFNADGKPGNALRI